MLKNALPMQSLIRRCWLITHRAPEREILPLLPAELRPVTHGGFAFLNIVVARMEAMRPQGLPAMLGLDYWHVGYRVYAKAATDAGEREGLYFLRSDCDRRLLALGGNLLSEFQFHVARIQVSEAGTETSIRVEAPGAQAALTLGRDRVTTLAEGSPFTSIAEAEAFLKYKPCGLAQAGPGRVNLLPIRREEAAWRARPVQAIRQEWEYLRGLPGARPELAFEVAPIEYRFDRGRIQEVR